MRPVPPSYLLEAERGHRRGVVLGLTMAEIMLLLLFCMLLVSAALLKDREDELARAVERSELAEQRAVDADRRAEAAALRLEAALTNSGGPLIDVIQLERDQAELATLREESSRLRELLGVAESALAEGPLPEVDWRELRLTQEAGNAVLESGLSLTEVVEKLGQLEAEAAAPTATPEEHLDEPLPAPPPSPIGHDWPPIITLGNDDFRFLTNSAELSDDFRTRLQSDIAAQVRELLAKYDVDIIEVVGHTDEQPIFSTRDSTLDQTAISVLAGTGAVRDLIPVDNAGLGLARAISVAKTLQEALSDTDVTVIPLSAAQLVLPGDIISDGIDGTDNQNRRRIEIRVRRSSPGATE